MMAAAARIEAFDSTQKTFDRYIQRVKIHFSAADVAADRQKLCSSTQKELHATNLVSPATPVSKTFDQPVETLKSSIISERYSFHCRCQEPGESLTDFVVGLTRLIVRCGYDNAFQPILVHVHDRFVCGLQNESTRKRLLTEDDALTLEKAFEIATSVQKQPLVSTSVLHMSSNKKHHVPSSPFPTCHRCWVPAHCFKLAVRKGKVSFLWQNRPHSFCLPKQTTINNSYSQPSEETQSSENCFNHFQLDR